MTFLNPFVFRLVFCLFVCFGGVILVFSEKSDLRTASAYFSLAFEARMLPWEQAVFEWAFPDDILYYKWILSHLSVGVTYSYRLLETNGWLFSFLNCCPVWCSLMERWVLFVFVLSQRACSSPASDITRTRLHAVLGNFFLVYSGDLVPQREQWAITLMLISCIRHAGVCVKRSSSFLQCVSS